MEIQSVISRRLNPSSDFIWGLANIHGFLPDEYNNYSLGISIGKRLDDKIVDAVAHDPDTDYFYHFRQVNSELEAVSNSIAGDLKARGLKCITVIPSLPLSSDEFKPYLKTLRYKLSHKMVATRAGLGWIGKTGLFVSEAFGPRLRLVSILIESSESVASIPVEESKCGNCEICVRKCPAHAANGISWTTQIDRDKFFNARKCREKCLEYGRHLFGKDVGVCGICVAVCPVGRQGKHDCG